MDGCVMGFYFEWRLDKANAISAHFTYIRSAPLKRGGEINDEDPAVPDENAGVSPAARTPCGVDPRSGFSELFRGSVHVPAFDESAG